MNAPRNIPPRHLSIRNVPPEVAEALQTEKERLDLSLNQTVIELLRQSLGVAGTRSNGLRRLAGNWNEKEHAAFEKAIASTEQIDEELWR